MLLAATNRIAIGLKIVCIMAKRAEKDHSVVLLSSEVRERLETVSENVSLVIKQIKSKWTMSCSIVHTFYDLCIITLFVVSTESLRIEYYYVYPKV